MQIGNQNIRPMPGMAIVKITETLEKKRNGIIIPGHTQRHMGKDSGYGVLMELGPRPQTEHEKRGDERPQGMKPCNEVWPENVWSQFQVGHSVVIPRDLPKRLQDDRFIYGLIHLHEVLLVIEDLDPEKFWMETRKLGE